mgnify:CR=1 FL=1
MSALRPDLVRIASLVPQGARVLDVGCGSGDLMQVLEQERGCDARGIEIDAEEVARAVSRGLSVVQGDANRDLADYPDGAFDVAVLSQTLQTAQRPDWLLDQLLRVGREAFVSFPNFAYWRMRLSLLLHGRMPQTDVLPYEWYETPNIHFCTIRDFVALVEEIGARIDRTIALDASGNRLESSASLTRLNLLGEQAIFMLSRPGQGDD